MNLLKSYTSIQTSTLYIRSEEMLTLTKQKLTNLSSIYIPLHTFIEVLLASKMMQKILVKLHLHCDKCRTKALKIAATTPGVTKMSIVGAEKDHLEVIGNGVDSVGLTSALRKKLGFANIVKVEQVLAGEARRDYSDEERPTQIQYCTAATTSSYYGHPQQQIGYPTLYYSHEPTHYDDGCSIM